MVKASTALVFAVSLLSIQTHALTFGTVEEVPNPTKEYGGLISDPGAALATEDRDSINRDLQRMEHVRGAQMAIVVLGSIGEQDPREFANLLFAHWGVGDREKDNGLLLLLVLDQRSWTIETGYGMEWRLPDALCAQIGREHLVPYLKQGDYAAGIRALVQSIDSALADDAAGVETQRARRIRADADDGNPSIPPLIAVASIVLGGMGGGFAVAGWAGAPIVFPIAGWLLLLLAMYLMVGALAKLRTINGEAVNLYQKYSKLERIMPRIVGLTFLFPFAAILPWVLFLSRRRYYRVGPRFWDGGKPMKRLDEKDDDLFLNDGQQDEEMVKSVDYDVWVTEDRSETLVLRYNRRSPYQKCPGCSFRTYRKSETRIIRYPTTGSTGVAEDVYSCLHCGYKKTQQRTLPTTSSGSSSSHHGSSFSSHSSGSSFGGGHSGGGGAGGRW